MNNKLRKAKAVMIPFGYPGYPKEYLERFMHHSEEVVRKLGIELITTDLVKEFKEARKIKETIRKYKVYLMKEV